jgi:Cu(I)/Ag(I) efflux system membrane fusion protein
MNRINMLSTGIRTDVGVNARVAGRIEKLYVKSTGELIRKGDRLYEIYSEALNTAKAEYVLALEQQHTMDHSLIDFKQLVGSAKQKLLLWGMSEAQISALPLSKMPSVMTHLLQHG